ncbi:hypothetical protein, partial [Parapedobacter sp. 10938]|uniref:hypothetical protein n=1 Tax=Parapedobacter flavus TaxID=3110225 RepID=UPI002DBD069B
MRYDIFILLVAGLLLHVSSCASRRSRYVEDARKVLAIHHTEQRTTDSQAHRLTIERHLDSLGYCETATITPLGRFTYHPDSGYRGQAILVQLRRRGVHTERHARHDSTQHLSRTTANVADHVATHETHALERQEKHHIPWRWAVAALVLLLVMGFLAR